MASQEKFAAKVQPFLPPGETFHAAFALQAGPHPLLPVVSPITVFFIKRRMVVVTNQAVYLCSMKPMSGYTPKKMLHHYPIGTRLVCNETGNYSKLFLSGTRHWVNRSELGEVANADRISQELAEAETEFATI